MDLPFNVALIKNPINWVIVFLMIIFAMFIMEMLFQFAGKNVPCGCLTSSESK